MTKIINTLLGCLAFCSFSYGQIVAQTTVPIVGANLATPNTYDACLRYLSVDAPIMWKTLQFPPGAAARMWVPSADNTTKALGSFCQQTGAKVIFTLGMNQSPEAVVHAITVLGPSNVLAVEGWNEPEQRTGENAATYTATRDAQKALYQAIRSHTEFSKIIVVGPAYAPNSGGVLGAALDIAKWCDVGNMHDYTTARMDGTPTGYARNAFIQKSISFAKYAYTKNGKLMSIWVTEWGRYTPYDPDPESSNVDMFANYLYTQWWILSGRWPGVPKVVYDLNERSWMGRVGRFGLFDDYYQPKGSVLSTLVPCWKK